MTAPYQWATSSYFFTDDTDQGSGLRAIPLKGPFSTQARDSIAERYPQIAQAVFDAVLSGRGQHTHRHARVHTHTHTHEQEQSQAPSTHGSFKSSVGKGNLFAAFALLTSAATTLISV